MNQNHELAHEALSKQFEEHFKDQVESGDFSQQGHRDLEFSRQSVKRRTHEADITKAVQGSPREIANAGSVTTTKAHVVNRSPDQVEKREDTVIRQRGVKMPKGSKFQLAPVTERERRPFAKSGWREYDAPAVVRADGPASAWRRHGLLVISNLGKKVEAPDGTGDVTPQWMLSISVYDKSRRPTDEEVRTTLVCFQMTEAEEDNHFPGLARMYFLVVDPARRVDCECKTTEEVVTEPDGYKWSREKRADGREVERIRAPFPPWSELPIGARAFGPMGGWWEKTDDGWKANGGDTFPTPGGGVIYVDRPIAEPTP